MSHPKELRVLVAAVDSLARAGLAALVSDLPECEVVGQTAGDEKLEDELELYEPDVMVWDLGLDPTQTLDRLASLRDSGTPVVALVPSEGISGIAWAGGARGILSRQVEGAGLLAAMRAVTEGLTAIDSHLADELFSVREPVPEQPVESLTSRELEVLWLLADGQPNKSIASRLDISEHTVKFHVNSILGKLGAQSRTQAVSLATRLGLIKL